MNQVRIYSRASRQMEDIWVWTAKRFGERQANRYIDEMVDVIQQTAERRRIWRTMPGAEFEGVFFVKCGRHFVFFRDLSSKKMGVISVLHEVNDIPAGLRDVLS